MEENDLIAVESLDSIDAEHNVFTEPIHPIHPIKYALMSLGKSLFGLVKWFIGLLWSMVTSLGNFFLTVAVGAYKGVVGIYKFFARKYHQFKYNDWPGRLSYFVFGASSYANKKFAFGILYSLFQIGYILLFSLSGFKCIKMLSSLGTQAAYEDTSFDEEFPEMVPGDNSIMILIYGLLWSISIIIFLYIWNRSINDGYNNYRVNKLLTFEKIYKNNIEFGKHLDDEVEVAFNEGKSFSSIKKELMVEVRAYLEQFDKSERSYLLYLYKNTLSHKYRFLCKARKENSKLAKLQAKHDKVVATREAGLKDLLERQEGLLLKLKENDASNDKLVAYEEKSHIKAELYKNKTISLVNICNQKCKKQQHRMDELAKRFSPYIELQLINNNKKYGKNNNYYKHIAKLESNITFYSNYEKFLRIYNEGLVKFDEKNQENAQAAVDLLEEYNKKIESTKTKFSQIRARREALLAELKNNEVAYRLAVKELRAKNPENLSELLMEEKAKLVDSTTILMRQVNDLPTLKNIKALEKEELKESKRAYVRDSKYLKTNYTGETLAFEDVVNEMVVEHKIEYRQAVAYAKSMHITRNVDGKKASDMLKVEEANEILKTKVAEKDAYIASHPDKYDVRFGTFMDSVKNLFNNKFYITILFLPVLGIVLFSIVPLIFSIFVAFTNYSKGYEPPMQLFTWIGFENFKTIFNPDPTTQFAALPSALGKTLGWTLTWAVIATFSNYILGIVVALMINKEGIKFKKLWRTVFVMTIAIPQFISLLSIGTLLKDSGAIGHWYFETFGNRLGFGTDGSANAVLIAKIVIILVNVWIGIPYTILSTTGILLNIPKDLYESAKVDGSSTFTQFTKITMPYILFVTGPYLITQFIGNINNFNVIFFLTGGGPALAGSSVLGLGETDLLITFIYKVVTSTSNPQYGIASAIGILVFIICSFISIVMYNKSGSIKEEDQFQ